MASTSSEDVSNVLLALSHPLRREILVTLNENDECSFTDLLNALKIDTGKLSFHLRTLAVFVEQTASGKYKLSIVGENALRVIRDVQFWAEASEVKRKSSQLPIASFKRRTYAFLIDALLVFAITTPISIAQFLALFSGHVSLLNLSFEFLVFQAFFWAYSTLLEGLDGQSLGKYLLGLKVIKTNDKKATYGNVGVRNFGKIFLLPFDVAFGLHLKDPTFIRYFDRFAGTTVIDLRLILVESTPETKKTP
jgi:uncharacterized RDD family membrane protein YckC/DNA-binding transcriptional ArsR family regulator